MSSRSGAAVVRVIESYVSALHIQLVFSIPFSLALDELVKEHVLSVGSPFQ